MDRVGWIGDLLSELLRFALQSTPCSFREAVLEMLVDAVIVGMNPDHLEEQRIPQRLL